jgi:hypothetical protein
MNPQMKSHIAASKGNKTNFHCYQNPKDYSTNNRKQSPFDFSYNNNGYSNLPTHKSNYPVQYPSNFNNSVTKVKKNKLAPYPVQKNVGAKQFRKDDYSESLYFAKNHVKTIEPAKLSPDRMQKNLSGCSTMPSEEELTNSVLHGFRVVHDGRTLHDEAQFDESQDVTPNANKKRPLIKFASSTYTIGPNPKDISLPSFFDDE